jgi:hypothetical protein
LPKTSSASAAIDSDHDSSSYSGDSEADDEDIKKFYKLKGAAAGINQEK